MSPRHLSRLLPLLLVCALPACTRAHAAQADASPPEVRVDHVLHAGKYKIPCLYCHDHADDATVAGVPSLQKCMGCHKYVDKKKADVIALAKDYNDGTPPVWPRQYTLPGYVYFSHRMHVNNGIDCKSCHGDVAKMHVVQRVAPLNMGWCLNCHKQHGAPQDCTVCHK